MPLPKRQRLPVKGGTPKEGSKKDDSRFANFQTDPKFQLPSKKHTKTKLDSRFSRLLNDPDFYNKATVDKYGRKVDKNAGKKELQRFYHQDEDEEEDDDDDEGGDNRKDKSVRKELAKVEKRGANYDPLRDGGFSESSSDESSSDDEVDEEEEEVEEQTELAGHGNAVPMGDVTSRLAAVNMDWDNIRASDIMAVTSSFVPADGRILNVTIYPSEFGLERLQREEIEGPPREIFASSSGKNKNNITSVQDLDEREVSPDDEQIKKELLEEGAAEDFDSKALRTYQLDRLRYYYAVITCSSKSAAKAIYDNLDGREYLTSANFFDLRFIPDDTTFDKDPHDECADLEDGYKPNEFVTDALSHSKVKLTWDAEDTTRKEAQKRAFSRKEIDENELKAYLGSDSESEAEDSTKVDKAAALRAKLGLDAPGETTRSKTSKASSKRDRDFQKPEGEMEVTFSAGLSANAPSGSVFLNEPETALETYMRKQKERRIRRQKRGKAVAEGRDPDAIDNADEQPHVGNGEEDDPFNDPFFDLGSEAAKKAEITHRKAERAKKREEREKNEKEEATKRAELELLMVDDKETHLRHFDMNDIIKSEKAAKKSKKKNKKSDPKTEASTEDTFALDVQDPRFAKLYESHEFAIDPTNPRFKETKGMKALLEEGRKKRKRDKREDGPGEEIVEKKSKGTGVEEADDLKKLAARVKAKSKKAKI